MRLSKNTNGTQTIPVLVRCEYNRDSFPTTYFDVAWKDGEDLNPVILEERGI